jgi:cell division FtsZ-interacting protein ZapD
MASLSFSPGNPSLLSLPGELEQLTVPAELQESVERHQRHLAALVQSLRAAGVDETVIEASVSQLLESYRDELTAAMRALVLETARA